MARGKINPIILLLTVVIAIGAIVSILGFAVDIGIIDVGIIERPNESPPLAEIPVIVDDPDETMQDNDLNEDLGIPEGFVNSEEDIFSAFLDTIGIRITETFGVDTTVRLVDANLQEQIENSFLKVQPLDPRKVITVPDEELSTLRFFINTDFNTQLNDAGDRHHKFSSWSTVNNFGNGAPIPVVITTTNQCSGVPNTGLCVQVIGSKSDDDETANGSVIHGISKDIDVSDWTREGELFLGFDYSCNQNFIRNARIITVIKGDFGDTIELPCLFEQKFKMDVSEFVGNSNKLTVQIGTQARNVDKFRMDVVFNNVFLAGNSVIKRDAIELFESLSIVQNNEEQTVLDLGFIEVSALGKTVFDGERVVVNGILETRIDGKTISKHDVTGNGITTGNQIPLRIDGESSFLFKLDEQFYDEDTFHKFDIILNDFIVNIGQGEEQRTFEYHTPFVAYTLEFNVKPDEIVAFNEKDKAISVLKSDTKFQTCGLTSGEDPMGEPEVLPPEVSIIQNGFTIATTNPSAGKTGVTDPFTGELGKNMEFCSVIANLPRDTTLTFKIGNEFFEKNIPSTQQNYFVKCVREGCTSNIGYVSNP